MCDVNRHGMGCARVKFERKTAAKIIFEFRTHFNRSSLFWFIYNVSNVGLGFFLFIFFWMPFSCPSQCDRTLMCQSFSQIYSQSPISNAVSNSWKKILCRIVCTFFSYKWREVEKLDNLLINIEHHSLIDLPEGCVVKEISDLIAGYIILGALGAVLPLLIYYYY